MAIKVCAIVDIIIGILNFIFIRDSEEDKKEKPESVVELTKGLFKCLTIPRVWILVGIIFTAYSVYGLIGYVNTYAVNYYGLSATMGSTLGGIRYLLQGVGGIVGGILADKLHSRIKVVGRRSRITCNFICTIYRTSGKWKSCEWQLLLTLSWV